MTWKEHGSRVEIWIKLQKRHRRGNRGRGIKTNALPLSQAAAQSCIAVPNIPVINENRDHKGRLIDNLEEKIEGKKIN